MSFQAIENTIARMPKIVFLLIALYLVFIFYKVRSWHDYRQKMMWLTLFSCIFAIVQVLFYYYLYLLNENEWAGNVMTIVTACCVVILAAHGVILEYIGRMIQKQKIQSEKEKQMMKREYEYDYYLLAREQSEAAKKMKQDMWEQLDVVQEMFQKESKIEKEKVQKMLLKMDAQVSKIGRIYYCQDALLNTILSLWQEKAQKEGLDMKIQVDSMVKTNMDDIDLCCILMNLLDNAIEASAQVKEETANEKIPEIRVHIGRRGGYLAIKVENSIRGTLNFNEEGIMTTSKKEQVQDHGRGLNIVKRTIAKYNGHFEIQMAKDIITILVFLPKKLLE